MGSTDHFARIRLRGAKRVGAFRTKIRCVNGGLFESVSRLSSLNLLQFTNDDSNHYKFTGKERDAETGLDYFGARYYSNGLGRFITPDWADKAAAVAYADFADPQSLNLYTYVRNIPTSKVDPDGHECPECPAIERILEGVAESPAGRAIAEKSGQIAGAIGTGLAAGWAYTSGFAERPLMLLDLHADK
jgi:RHS repeat-associated protein